MDYLLVSLGKQIFIASRMFLDYFNNAKKLYDFSEMRGFSEGFIYLAIRKHSIGIPFVQINMKM